MSDSQDKPDDKLLCFLNKDRFCGPDCMAYKTIPDDNKQLDKGQQHCVLLSAIERTGRSTNIIAQLIDTILKRDKTKDADAKRGSPPAPPSPYGG